MQLGLPKRVLALAEDKELEEIKRTITMSKSLSIQMAVAHQSDRPKWRGFRKRYRQTRLELRYWRAVLRQRYALSLGPGIYTVTRKTTHGRSGRYGNEEWRRVPKRTLLVWVERNELGWNFFMLPSNEVVSIRGTDLDAVVAVPADTEESSPGSLRV